MIAELFLVGALALPPVTFRPPLTDADQIVHAFTAMLTQSGTLDDVLFIQKPWEWSQVRRRLIDLPWGGFVYIQGKQSDFHFWFNSHTWMHMPFMWRDYHIYKKSFDHGISVVGKKGPRKTNRSS